MELEVCDCANCGGTGKVEADCPVCEGGSTNILEVREQQAMEEQRIWYAALSTGDIVHLCDAGNAFFRCEVEVVRDDEVGSDRYAGRRLRKIALVGDWPPFLQKKAVEMHDYRKSRRDLLYSAHYGNLYESPQFVGTSRRAIDPTKLDAVVVF